MLKITRNSQIHIFLGNRAFILKIILNILNKGLNESCTFAGETS